MRITDGTETMEVSVREYGDHSDREITDQTLPSLVEWAETPGIVENVRRTAQRLVELFANDGKNARTILGYIPDGTKLGLGIRLYAPDIRDDGRGLPDDIRLTRYMRVGRPSSGVVVETELYRLGNVLCGRDLSGLDLRYLDFSGVELYDASLIARGNGWRLNYRNNGLDCVLTFDWRNGCPEPRTLAHNPKWADISNRNRIEEIRFVPGSKAPEDMSVFFEDMWALRRVDFTNLDMSKTVSLAWMFNNAGDGDVEIVNLKAPNARDCERLFRLGPDVTSLKVPGLDVSGAEVAREMFGTWNRITELDLSELRLPQAKDINRMFTFCERLRKLDISNLELPPDVKTDDGTPTMFSNCVALEHVDMPVRGALSDRYGEMMKRLNAGDRAVLKARPYPRVTILAL